MKFLIVAVALGLCLAVVAARDYDLDEHPRKLWKLWLLDFPQPFVSDKERESTYSIFAANVQKIKALNAKYDGKATFALNEFAAIEEQEFLTTRGGLRVAQRWREARLTWNITMARLFTPDEIAAAPTTFDWRSHNPPVVNPIKNQGDCGDCWAFSATANVESVWAIAGHTLVSLSEQQLCDCDTASSCCDGGFMNNAFQYLIKCGGQDTESSYPYKGFAGKCKFNKANIGAKITSFQQIAHDPVQMATQVGTVGPISVAVDATSWQFYKGGIIKSNCGTQLDHGVEIVGYASKAGTDYWIVRNSWGKSWGMSGYLYVERGPDDMCGIDKAPSTSVA